MARFADLEVAPRFWELVAAANRSQKRLRGLLMVADRDELVQFHTEFGYMVSDLVDNVVEEDGDTFHEEDVAGWVVSQGLAHFAQVYDNPEEFPADMPSRRTSLKGVASVVWEERFGAELMPRCEVDRWPTILGGQLLRGGQAEPDAAPDPAGM